MLIVGLALSGVSYVVRPYLFVHSAEEIAYAREHAQESLGELEKAAQEAEKFRIQSPQKALDYYLDQEDRFSELKHAALHLKGDMAEDFVYAFDLAEQWCDYSARALNNPQDEQLQLIARQRYELACREFRLIMRKEYSRKQ